MLLSFLLASLVGAKEPPTDFQLWVFYWVVIMMGLAGLFGLACGIAKLRDDGVFRWVAAQFRRLAETLRLAGTMARDTWRRIFIVAEDK